MSPRPRETSDEELLAATHRVVSRLGPNLTLADVGREAGVSPATLMQRFGSKRGLLLAFAASGAQGLGDEFARIRQKRRSPLAALHDVAQCMAAMAETPETLSNSLAFLQMDLFDPDFHKHALAHSRGISPASRRCWTRPWRPASYSAATRHGWPAPSRGKLAARSSNGPSTAMARRRIDCARIWIHSSSRVTAPLANGGDLHGGL